jgi:hypothetical protein
MENIIQSKMTEQLTGATRREMRQLVDECVSTFSDRIENMHANFQNKGNNKDTQRQLCSQNFKGILKAVKLVSR